MSKATKLAAILGLAGALAGLPSLMAQDRDDRVDRDDAGVREAIRYERAKQAAADRQARIESGQERGDRDRDRDSVDRAATEPRARTRVRRPAAPAPRKDGQPQRNPRQ